LAEHKVWEGHPISVVDAQSVIEHLFIVFIAGGIAAQNVFQKRSPLSFLDFDQRNGSKLQDPKNSAR